MCLSRDSPAAPGHGQGGAGGHDLKELQPMESPHCSRFVLKNCSPWEGLTLEQRRSMQRNKHQRGVVMDNMQLPILSSPVPFGVGDEVEESEMKE